MVPLQNLITYRLILERFTPPSARISQHALARCSTVIYYTHTIHAFLETNSCPFDHNPELDVIQKSLGTTFVTFQQNFILKYVHLKWMLIQCNVLSVQSIAAPFGEQAVSLWSLALIHPFFYVSASPLTIVHSLSFLPYPVMGRLAPFAHRKTAGQSW